MIEPGCNAVARRRAGGRLAAATTWTESPGHSRARYFARTSRGGWLLGKPLHYDDSVHMPFEESIDPDGPNFLRFYEPWPIKNGALSCGVSRIEQIDRVPQMIWDVIFGRNMTAMRSGRGAAGAMQSRSSGLPELTEEDWNDWRMIRIRPPEPGEDPSIFWELPAFPRQGPGRPGAPAEHTVRGLHDDPGVLRQLAHQLEQPRTSHGQSNPDSGKSLQRLLSRLAEPTDVQGKALARGPP